jgi:hypothetical protein
MNLGIIWKNGQIINHRSLLKVICNPVLRCVGWQISSVFDKNEFIGYNLTRCPRQISHSFCYDVSGCTVERKRMFV